MPRVVITIEAEVENVRGEPVPKGDLIDLLQDEMNNANPGGFFINGSEYMIDDWTVTAE